MVDERIPLRAVEAPDIAVPSDRRPPFGWRIVGVGRDRPMRLAFPSVDDAARVGLRLTWGLDSREAMLAQVSLAGGGPIATLDLRFAFVHQPIVVDLPASAFVAGGTLEFRLAQGKGPAWFFADDASVPSMVRPHLSVQRGANDVDPVAALRRWLVTPASLQQFGWRLGCVLDGLADLGERDTVASHLAMFFDDRGRLNYENPRSEPIVDSIYGIEGTLPFAHMARLKPDHASIDRCIDFWLNSRDEEGNVGGVFTSAEGSYTIAYPMAVIGRVRQRRDLTDLALHQLVIRRDRLRDGDAIWLRNHGGGQRTFRNWARGCAWYLLGLARTLIEVGPDAGEPAAALRAEFADAITLVLRHQHAQGLWSNFVDDQAIPIDTSGSAGIAAAIALGARRGLLPHSRLVHAERARDALLGYITRDGLLAGAAQDNKGGEELQRSDYRVVHPAGAGLWAQLIAALDHPR
jgi:unsaturated rhamnogalacturonyl hydrolase